MTSFSFHVVPQPGEPNILKVFTVFILDLSNITKNSLVSIFHSVFYDSYDRNIWVQCPECRLFDQYVIHYRFKNYKKCHKLHIFFIRKVNKVEIFRFKVGYRKRLGSVFLRYGTLLYKRVTCMAYLLIYFWLPDFCCAVDVKKLPEYGDIENKSYLKTN